MPPPLFVCLRHYRASGTAPAAIIAVRPLLLYCHYSVLFITPGGHSGRRGLLRLPRACFQPPAAPAARWRSHRFAGAPSALAAPARPPGPGRFHLPLIRGHFACAVRTPPPPLCHRLLRIAAIIICAITPLAIHRYLICRTIIFITPSRSAGHSPGHLFVRLPGHHFICLLR